MPAKRGKGASISNAQVGISTERHAAMTWAQRLKRVFSIESEVCRRCGGSVRVIACIKDQDILDRILAHLESKNTPALPHLAPPTRAPPGTMSLFAGSEPTTQISKDTTEKRVARTVAYSRSGMNGYELRITGANKFSGQ
jgi:hypothetical protein